MTSRSTAGSLWCILRTRGQWSIRLARSLSDVGLQAWTPSKFETKRKLRSRDRVDLEVPIMPTFVFVPSVHVPQLRRIMRAPAGPHPAFSIFHYSGAIPLITDAELTSLRAVEADARLERRKAVRHDFAKGTPVRADQPAFLGLTGVIEACDGKRAMVNFGGGLVINIGAWLLQADELQAA